MMWNKKILILLSVFMVLIVLPAAGFADVKKKHTLLIDPAHGGNEPGLKLSGDVYEKDITLKLGLLIKKELSDENNLAVVLTRDTDKTVSVESRRQMAEKIQPDFFLILHVNGGFDKHASGFELYYPEFGEETKVKKRQNRDKPGPLRSQLGNDSLTMAKIVQDNLNVLFPRKGRGLRKADNPVNDGLMIPSLVVETGFATNSDDKKKLLSAKKQEEVAKALAKSVKKYFR